jgi:hypothetical protein
MIRTKMRGLEQYRSRHGAFELRRQSGRAPAPKAQRTLGWRPRSREDAVVATAERRLKLGLVDAK